MLTDWTPVVVIGRLAQAYDVIHRLPGARRPTLSAMPWYDARNSFEEAVWAEEGRQRRDSTGKVILGRDQYRTPQTYWADSVTRTVPPDARAIDAAFATLEWLKLLDGRRDLVDALWFCHGQGLGPTEAARAIARYRKTHPQTRQTVRVKRDQAVSMIVKALRVRDLRPSERMGAKLRAGLSLAV